MKASDLDKASHLINIRDALRSKLRDIDKAGAVGVVRKFVFEEYNYVSGLEKKFEINISGSESANADKRRQELTADFLIRVRQLFVADLAEVENELKILGVALDE